jgi:hypothetical protein
MRAYSIRALAHADQLAPPFGGTAARGQAPAVDAAPPQAIRGDDADITGQRSACLADL